MEGLQTSVANLAVRRNELEADGPGLAAIARDRLSRAARFPNQAFVFVHGYNNSFEDAVRRTAMIAFDLDFDGATFLFTWPSHGKPSAYVSDRKRARAAAPFLVALLRKIGTDPLDVKLHMIAHSTGAEIALSAVTALADQPGQGPRPTLGELILAHADVDPTRLDKVTPVLKKLGMGVTSYSSRYDQALLLAKIAAFSGATVLEPSPSISRASTPSTLLALVEDTQSSAITPCSSTIRWCSAT